MSHLHTIRTKYEKMQFNDVTGIIAQGDATQLLDGSTSGYTFDFTNKKSGAKELPHEANGITIQVQGYDVADDGAFTLNVWGYPEDGPAELMCEATCAWGTARVSDVTWVSDPSDNLYADTIDVTTLAHIRDMSGVDSGNNRICKLWTDAVGYRWIYPEFAGISGAGEALDSTGSMNAFVRWF